MKTKTMKEFLEEYKKAHKLEEILIKGEYVPIVYWGTAEEFYSEIFKKTRLEIETWKVKNIISYDDGRKLLIETNI